MARQPPLMSPQQAAGENEAVAREDTHEIRNGLDGGVVTEAASKIMRALDIACLDIAVIGELGFGKFTLINTLRGLMDGDDGAAFLWVVVKSPTPYIHPMHPTMTVWDLPGVGTSPFQPSAYLERVHFSRYDFFIFVTSTCFELQHVQLAHEIQKRGKRFYFVRSEIEADLIHAQIWVRPYDGHGLLDQIQDSCEEDLESKGLGSPKVFLLSNWYPFNADFPMLIETLGKELPTHKRHEFLLALPNVSLRFLDMKKEDLQTQLWMWAAISCVVAAAVPTPGLSMACDVAILITAISEFRQSFGLGEESLYKLAKTVSKPVDEIKGVIRSPLAREISKDQVLKLLGSVVCGALLAVESLGSILPGFGSLVKGGISFGKMYYLLYSSLNEVADDAKRVLIKALGLDGQMFS